MSIYRLTPTNEFLRVYKPHPGSEFTEYTMSKHYKEINAARDMIEYIQYKMVNSGGGEELMTKEQGSHRIQEETKKLEGGSQRTSIQQDQSKIDPGGK